MVECLTRDRHINPSLVLVQPRNTCPYISERLLMGRKIKSNKQTIMHLRMPSDYAVYSTLLLAIFPYGGL